MSNLNYGKWATGYRQITGTKNGVSPVAGDTSPNIFDANYSSATMTAPVAVTYGSVSYAADDILFYSDGYSIFDSTGAVMNGDGGSTGGFKSMPQSVYIVSPPKALQISSGLSKTGDTLFWVIQNAYTKGLIVGLVNMAGNGGLGTFSNWVKSQQTPSGGALGTMLNTQGGMGGRLKVACSQDASGEVDGVLVICKKVVLNSGPSHVDTGWVVFRLNAIMTASGTGQGFPVITTGQALGVSSNVGTTMATSNAGPNGTIAITKADTSNSISNYKIATIYNEAVGTSSNTVTTARVEVLSLNGTTLVISNPANKNFSMLDSGALPWPIPSGNNQRFYPLSLEFSHSSNSTTATLYYPSIETITGAPHKLVMNWVSINSVNAFSTSVLGQVEILDGNGNNIWGVANSPGRIIAGIWRDPNKDGRIFVSTPEQVDRQGLAIVNSAPIWNISYPEIWGTLSSPNVIQHCILENTDNPSAGSPPTQTNVGVLDTDTYYRFGAPTFVPCFTASTSLPPVYLKKCTENAYIMDTTNTLWKYTQSMNGGATPSSVNRITTIGGMTTFKCISAHQYTDLLYLWYSPTSTTSLLSYKKYNQKCNQTINGSAIAVGTTWAVINHIGSVVWVSPPGSSVANPSTSCDKHLAFGLKAGSSTIYGFTTIDTTTNTLDAFNATGQIDTASALGNALQGKIPKGLAIVKDVLLTTTYWSYVCFDDKICKYDHITNIWTLISTLPAVANTFWISQVGSNPMLFAQTGATGSLINYSITVPGGTVTAQGSVVTDPGLFTWGDRGVSQVHPMASSYYQYAPMKIADTDPDYQFYFDNYCGITPSTGFDMQCSIEHPGCWSCTQPTDNNVYHSITTACSWPAPSGHGQLIDNCRICYDSLPNDCMAFIPCCNQTGTNTGLGPIELPGIAIANPGSYTAGDVYSVSSGGAAPVCATAENPEEHFWFTTPTQMMGITNISTGTTLEPAFSVNTVFTSLEDVTFDKHGNVVYTEGPNSISWASVWDTQVSNGVLITNTFNVPQMLDTDYTSVGHIIGGDMTGGLATFSRFTNSLAGGMTFVGAVTNATISLGFDLSVDYNSGDYFVLGDVTGAGGLDDLMSIDDATGNHTFIVDLATLLSFSSSQHAYGIERVRDTAALSFTYILSAEEISAGQYAIYLHKVSDNGLANLGFVPLINSTTSTNNWPSLPNGLGFNDICNKWPNNVDPVTQIYSDCSTCNTAPSTVPCCYKLTNCDTGVIQYSNQSLLSTYVGQIIRLSGGSCWNVEASLVCSSPVSIIPDTNPGPYSTCVDCAVPPVVYYKLPKCGDPTNILYTDDSGGATSTPGITGFFSAGVVVQITGECFCREVQINPTGPQGTEAALSISSLVPGCSGCIYSIRLEDCITGAITNVDYNSSPTLVPYIGAAAAHDVTVGGVALTNCQRVLVGCIGPSTTTYPVGVATTTYADCTVCAAAGQTCVKISHCCGPTYVGDQIVNVTSGITAADIGLVVQADIVISGIIYNGCWTVSATTCSSAVLPNSDVTPIATATVGSGNMPDCTYCAVTPCPVACTLLESCDNPGTTITVSGGLGSVIGSDVVELAGQLGCWKQCTSSGNPVAGTHWFYGKTLGIDFSSGAAVNVFTGSSAMGLYNSSNAINSLDYTFRGSAVHSSTGAATIGGHAFGTGDLMFYTDGHYIYDRTHTAMNTDAGPMHKGDANVGLVSADGRTFPAQGAVIIPVTAGGNTNGVWHKYYVIQNSCDNGPIKWSIIDMTLNSGKGLVVNATKNTTLIASACEYMCVSTTIGSGATAYWNLFYLPAMATSSDFANGHVAGIKFDSTGISSPFVAVDLQQGSMRTWTPLQRGSGEMCINQTNDVLAYRKKRAVNPLSGDAYTLMVWGMNPTTGLSSTASLGIQQTVGYNGGAGNGVFSWIIGGLLQDQQPTSGPWSGLDALNTARTFTFSPDGKLLWMGGSSYYDTASPYTTTLGLSGFSLTAWKVVQYGQDLNVTQAYIPLSGTDDAALFDSSSSQYAWGLNSSAVQPIKSFPDASTPSGWYGIPRDEDRCAVVLQDMTFAPDGKLWISVVEQDQNMAYTQKLGGGAQITNSILRLDDPNNAFSVQEGLVGNIPVASFDIGSRAMGTRFPVWLQMPCPCDPANVITPDPVITTTHTDCTDCAVQPSQCYKLTECVCTGGTSGPVNQCSVSDPAVMPPDMVTYGKTWSTTCTGGSTGQRWGAVVAAVTALGTTASPGSNQTVNMSYSFINAGASFPIGYPGFGPALAVEQGPGTVNNTGISSSCNVYIKTYTITHTQFKAEMVTMFNNIKAMLEGMFNTNCGYGANLTMVFTDLGYETGYTSGDPAMGTNTIVSGNGTSFTDSNGVAGIGDFRIGFSDFGAIDGPCGNTGSASSILGLCFTGNINGSAPGTVKTSPELGLLLFDRNEDWRKAGDAVVANSFSLIRVGIHEILHAFGYGHDWLTFGANAANCACPCYQGDSTCPSMYPPPGGAIYNADALMGPFSSSNSFATDFPTGLMGPEGIYDRRATCGIYGNASANYGCLDGTCLSAPGGCTYIEEYSDDPALIAYVGGIITWDNGDPAGERCWEVEVVNPCPGGVTLVNPVNLVSGDPTLDCTDCTVTTNDCYTLNLCQCNTVAGAPASIVTDTDMSLICSGSVGTGQIIEIDLYPGACYEIDCTPIPCPASGSVTVVVTNTFPLCSDCCTANTQCYELCPCGGGGSATNSCSTHTIISNGVTGAWNNYQFYSANSAALLHGTLKFDTGFPPASSTDCVNSFTGNKITRLIGVAIGQAGTNPMLPLTGVPTAYWQQTSSWALCRADLVAAGYGNNTMDFNQMYAWLTANYAGTGSVNASLNGGPCNCTGGGCTVVTNDLSAEVGQVVTLGGSPPSPLNTSECYEVNLCGTCNTGTCNPTGAVVINTVHPDCPDCQNSTGCTCYKLIDCSDPSVVINNVCQTADLDTAFINGEIIQINGNTQTCWEVVCDDLLNCDPGTCLSVTVTATFASCTLCTGSQQWECAPLGGCNCVVSAGVGFPTQAACLASSGCCVNTPSWNCINNACIDPGDGTGTYTTLVGCQSNCGTPVSFNCIYIPATGQYSCIDPGDGSGLFPTNAACISAVNSNTAPCNIESYNCELINGVTQCIDPGNGTGTFNDTNGGLVACQGCNGCPLDPSCAGVVVSYDCDVAFGCIPNYTGTGAYPTIQACAVDCESYDPGEGTYEAECENCLTEPEMKLFFDKVADVCDDCNVPFGLTDQEVTCDTGCFGNSNIYVILDVTSTFGGTYAQRLAQMLTFKTNVIEPAFQQLQSNNPTYSGHLYIIPGAWPHAGFGPCYNCNNTGAAAPGSLTAPEDWLSWASYPLSGNAGANGSGANPMATGTLPSDKRTVLGHTMVDGIGGAPVDCNGSAYDASVHGPLLQQILILPGSYATDGFTQVNPWQDPTGFEGFSDPYHEFEGGDTNSIVIIFQDESAIGYHTTNTGNDNWGGSCGNALWSGAPGLNWHGIGLGTANGLTAQWKNDYKNYMELHEFGWNTSGVVNPPSTSYNVKQKAMLYVGSYVDHTVTALVDSRRDFLYHVFGAVGAQSIGANISYQGHIDCADYVPVPSMYNLQPYVATDVTIPNPYMGASGGGDPTLVTGYMGGSLSNYDMTFHVPNYTVQQLSSTMLYTLWKEYLSNC